MTNYTKTTNFAVKDDLPTGNAAKIVKGSEIDTEFNNIATASATKADANNSVLTGTTTFETLYDGSIAITAFVDEDNMASNSATLLPTQQSVKAYVDSQVTAQDLDFQADTGGALSIDLDSESMTFTGGTGIDTSGTLNTVTFAIDSTVATLTGTQTLTNKTLTSPTLNTPTIGTSFTIGSATITEAELEILDGATVTTAELNVLDGITSTTAELNILDGVTATSTELNYVDGVTSNIQTQLNAKAPLASPTFTGTVTAPTFSGDLSGTINSATTATTQSASDNSTKVATTAYVDSALGGGGAVVHISTTNVTSPVASVEVTLSGSYDYYILRYSDWNSGTASGYPEFSITTPSGSYSESVKYVRSGFGGDTSGSVNENASSSGSSLALFPLGRTNSANGSAYGEIHISNVAGMPSGHGKVCFIDDDQSLDLGFTDFAFGFVSPGATDTIGKIRIKDSVANTASGKFSLYGISTS